MNENIFINRVEDFESNDLKGTQYISYKCTVCGKDVSRQYRDKKILLCRKCATAETLNVKYNGKYKEIHYDELKRRMKEKYGVENISQLQSVKEKKKESSLKKYGTNCTLQAHEVKEKSKQTCLERYGVEHASQSEEIKQKVKQTSLERYGAKHYSQTEECKKRVEETCLKRYGSKSYLSSEKSLQERTERYQNMTEKEKQKIKEKIEKTSLERYGVKHYMQSPGALKKMCHRFNYDNTYFDSSWELAFWVYYKDHNKAIERCSQSFLLENGKRCFPDFITEEGLVEIKGDHLKKLDDWEYKKMLYEKEHIKILFFEDIKKYLKYCFETKSEEFLKTYKIWRYKKCVLEE